MKRLANLREHAKDPVSRYLDDLIDFGGEPRTRGEIIARMQKDGIAQPLIDRWLQGQELASRRLERHGGVRVRIVSTHPAP